jgi:hypothetical protein
MKTQNCINGKSEIERQKLLLSAYKRSLVHGYCHGRVPFQVVVREFRRHNLRGC